MDSFKLEISVLASAHDWTLAQIQFAEDYIDELCAYGVKATIPDGLDDDNARVIAGRFRRDHD